MRVHLVARAQLAVRRRVLHPLGIRLGMPPVRRARALRVDRPADRARWRAAAAAPPLDEILAQVDVLLLSVQCCPPIPRVHDAPPRHPHDRAQEFEPLVLRDLVLAHLRHALREEALAGIRLLVAVADEAATLGADHDVETPARVVGHACALQHARPKQRRGDGTSAPRH